MRHQKKALLVVSFGTTFENAVHAIEKIEDEFKETFPEYDFFRVFTSGMIIRKLKRTRGIEIMDMKRALQYLYEEGYTEVICQPTHIINGQEYEKVRNAVLPYKKLFQKLTMGEPLLTSEEDFKQTYSQMENMFRYLGRENVYVGTVEGFPGLDYIEKRLKTKKIKKVHLMLMMIVAGDHAQNDLAGEEDSWKSELLEKGYEVSEAITGMGLLDGIPQLYVERMKKNLLFSS